MSTDETNLPSPGGDESPIQPEDLPSERDKERIARISEHSTQIATASYHAGPLPAPETLAQYERILPGAAERILKMAEDQAQHRRALESRDLDADIRHTSLGTISGVVCALAGFATSAFLGYHGQQWASSIVAAMDIVGIVGIVVTGRYRVEPAGGDKDLPDKEPEERQLPQQTADDPK